MEDADLGVNVYNTLAKLLQKLLPASFSDDKRERLLKYYMRILGSTLGDSGYMMSDPLIMLKHIAQRLNRREENLELSQRVLNLYGQFEVSKSIRNKWAVLKVLEQLRGEKK